jgi:hypothetical protein
MPGDARIASISKAVTLRVRQIRKSKESTIPLVFSLP